LPKLAALGAAIGTINVWAIVLAAGTIAIIAVLRRLRPGWPGILIGVLIATVLASMLDLPVETIGSRFGGIPESIPLPSLPTLSWQKAQAVLPDAIAFALLGSIESLLSAVVADGMTGRRHRSNCELVAQGVGNMASALFGGISVTGLIARTATNIRAGARSPVSGIMHSVFVLLFILIAAPLASYVPLCALASVLVVVAWTMAEKHEFATLIRSSWGDAAVLLATFLLTVFRDLTEGIVVGFALGAMLFIHRMAEATAIESRVPLAEDDKADTSNGERVPYDAALSTDPDVIVYRISGAFFFGAASTIGAVLDRIPSGHKGLVIDFTAVPLLDSSAANVIARVAEKARRQGVRVFLTGASPQVRRELLVHGARPPRVRYRSDISSAVAEIKRKAALTASAAA
jgi:SulP family sulfate permease